MKFVVAQDYDEMIIAMNKKIELDAKNLKFANALI